MNIKLPPNDTAFTSRGDKIFEWGLSEWNIVKPKITSYRCCLDIGAHVGITTIRYSSFFEQVHSFEPVHFDLLEENTRELKNVFRYNTAISNKKDTVEIYQSIANSGACIIPDQYNRKIIENRHTGINARYKNSKPLLVQTVTIDSFNFTNVDFIKIDVEGHILPVLEGMLETLKRNNPVIQIETADSNTVNTNMRNILTSLDYKKFARYGNPADEFYAR